MAFDFNAAVTAPFRMQPGLRRMAADAKHLTPNLPGARALREKLAVLSGFADQALLCDLAFDATALVDGLVAHALHEHPAALSLDRGDNSGEATLTAHHLSWSLRGAEPLPLGPHAPPEIGACLAALPAPWRRTALLCLAFAEDFAGIDGATARIPWLAVCLPSNWAPAEKVGRHFAEVHAPVADNATLLAAGEHLARLVTRSEPGERWERFVWTITQHPRLHAHPAHVDPSPWPGAVYSDANADADHIANRAFFRTERQSFIALPGRGHAVFTIHVDVNPLSRVVNHAALARQMHAALASMSDAVLAYRGLTTVRGRLLRWLESRAV